MWSTTTLVFHWAPRRPVRPIPMSGRLAVPAGDPTELADPRLAEHHRHDRGTNTGGQQRQRERHTSAHPQECLGWSADNRLVSATNMAAP
jgi:hypothetical protein